MISASAAKSKISPYLEIPFPNIISNSACLNGEKIGQGRENSKKYLEEHPDIAETVEHAIRVHYGLLDEDTENANNDPKAETQISEEE